MSPLVEFVAAVFTLSVRLGLARPLATASRLGFASGNLTPSAQAHPRLAPKLSRSLHPRYAARYFLEEYLFVVSLASRGEASEPSFVASLSSTLAVPPRVLTSWLVSLPSVFTKHNPYGHVSSVPPSPPYRHVPSLAVLGALLMLRPTESLMRDSSLLLGYASSTRRIA